MLTLTKTKKMKKRIHLSAFLLCSAWLTCHADAAPTTVSFQNGVNSYTGTFDRRIGPGGEVDGSSVTADATTYYLDGGANTLNDNGYTQGLIRFSDIIGVGAGQIPAGAKVLSARLVVRTKTHGNAQSGGCYNTYRLTRAFDSSSSAGSTGDFGANGLEGDVDMIMGSFDVPAAGVEVAADVTAAVQSWVNGDPVYGIGIRSDRNTDGWSFHTTGATNAANRPRLEITYDTAVTITEDIRQQGLASYAASSMVIFNAPVPLAGPPIYTTIDGSTVSELFLDGINPPTLEPDVPAMLKFGNIETALANRQIQSAILQFVTGFSSSAADSQGPISIHRMLVPFSTSSVYGDFAGDAGAMLAAGQISPSIATITGMNDTEVVTADVSAAVAAWADGAPNHGLLLSCGTSNGWQVFTIGATSTMMRPILRVLSTPPPPIEITAPVASSRHVLGSTFTFSADAFATSPATVSQVEFFVNGVSVNVDTVAPYTFSYTASTLGNYTLTAIVTDSNAVANSATEVPFSVVPAAGSGGLYFDGIADHVGLGDAADLKLSTFTLETWFKRETPGVAANTGALVAIPLIAKGRDQAEGTTLDMNYFLGIRQSDGVLVADFEGGTGTNVPVAGSTVIPYGAWQHAACVFDGTQWKLYLNGNLEATVSANGVTPRMDSIQHASIATAMNSSGLSVGAFGGFMDEVRIWNTARSAEEIRATCNSEITSTTGLVARWAMTEGTGTSVTSTSGNALVGSVSGPATWTSGATFNNNIKPAVSFTSPSNNSTFLNTTGYTIAVNAVDPDGSVANVEYYDNGALVHTANSAPFSFTNPTPAVGTHVYLVIVTDNGGASTRSDNTLTINVTFPAPAVTNYSAALIDGADAELAIGNPVQDPAVWTYAMNSSAPRSWDTPGIVPGLIDLKISTVPVTITNGIVLTTNAVQNSNQSANDNIVSVFSSSGNLKLSSNDNSGPGDLDPLLAPESSSFAVGYFPYADGWVGAYVNADASIMETSSSLPAGATISNTATGVYTIAGLPVSGNVIATAVGENADHVVAVGRSGQNWIIQTFDNSGVLENQPFTFLYVQETARRVISGKVASDASISALNAEMNLLPVTCRSVAQGYKIQFGDGSVINPSNSVLLVSADIDAGVAGDNNFAYTANGNCFVVFSQDLPGLTNFHQAGGFRFIAVPLDSTTVPSDEVVVSTMDATATEGSGDTTVSFRVTRTGDTADEKTILYTTAGTATAGDDFTGAVGSIVIPIGSSFADVTLTVASDAVMEMTETVQLTLASGTGYTIGEYTSATAQIFDAASTVATTTVVFQQGLNGYAGQFQKRIGFDSGANTYTAQLGSAAANYAVDGGVPDINDLIRFDGIIGSGSGMIPANARVLKAELVLTTAVAGDAQSSGPFIIDRLTRAVDANTVYTDLDGGVGFEGARGAASGLPTSAYGTLAQGQAGAADVTGIVREWLSGESNHGFCILAGGTTDGWNYCTVGNANVALRPKLVVTYITTRNTEYNFTADQSALITSNPNGTTTDGSGVGESFLDLETNNTTEALLRFPVAFGSTSGQIPLDEEIVKAEMLVTTTFNPDAQSPGPIAIHQMTAPWTLSSSYGFFGPKHGADMISEPLQRISGLGLSSTAWVDVTAAVRAWRAGSANHGFLLKPETTNGWQMFFPGTPFAVAAPKLRITTSGGTATPFEAWATNAGAAGISISSDNDNDGINALLEYALGLNPLEADTLPAAQVSGGNISIAYPKGAAAAADSRISYIIKSSSDLQTWTAVTPTVDNSSNINFSTSTGAARLFFRLEVTYTP